MPNLDKTGPQGEGVGTGRGLGPCRRGSGARGFGRGCRNYAPLDDVHSLEQTKTILEEELRDVQEKLDSLKG